MKLSRPIIVLVFYASLMWYRPGLAGEWRRTLTSYLDFAGGTLSDGGANMYVAADGSVRLINQWDLNGDGCLDLVFSSSHDNNLGVDSVIYWGGTNGFDASNRTPLPGDGAAGLAVADLNNDGFPEVIIANEFNGTKTELHSFVYWGSQRGYSAHNRMVLPTVGATAVAAGDLNGDGNPDLVFASSGDSYQFSKAGSDVTFLRPASDIYWGSTAGYSAKNVSQLLTYRARDVKILDLSGDGYLDILFAEQGEAGHPGGVRIYCGTKSGSYSRRRMQFLPGLVTVAVTTADLNHDGCPEILVANEMRPAQRGESTLKDGYPIPSYIYWGSRTGYRIGRRTELPTAGARDVKVADLNDDGFADIVYANRIGGASYIYWGGAGSSGGYSHNQRSSLPTLRSSRCAIHDLNHDGRPDLVFSSENDERKNAVNSIVYWNSAEGFDTSRRTELPTLGAMGVAASDLNGDGWADLAFANARDGTAGEPVDTPIYWGNTSGKYSAAARQILKGRALMAYSSADLNADDSVDLVLVGKELRIFWGAAQGFSPANSVELPVHYAFNARAADLNRDGYLDLSVSDWWGSPDKDQVLIYWGGPSGYSAENRFALSCPGVRTHTLADLNGDGCLDILVSSTDGHAFIFWNGRSGFANNSKTLLPSRMAVSAEVADLNADGYLDIILCNLFAPEKLVRPVKPVEVSAPPQTATFAAGTHVYWGGPKGYSPANRLELPTVGSEDASVADMNRDGYLDLVISSYHAGDHRNHPSYVYWGSVHGLNLEGATLLPTKSASGVLVADFNADGWKDILFACHTDGTNHRTESFLYWGGRPGFSSDRRTQVPSVGVHFMSVTDVGNIADRSDEFSYISEPFHAGETAQFKSISWEGFTPFKSGLKFQVRFGSSREALSKATWLGPNGSGSFFTVSGTALSGQARWIQYGTTFTSPEGANSPVLNSVTLEYGN